MLGPVRVVILARTQKEANAYIALANLAPADVIVPASGKSLAGVRLEGGDLIAEFPNFDQHHNAGAIRMALLTVLTRNEQQPRWQVIGK